MEKQTKATSIYAAVGAITGWLAIILQLYLIIQNRAVSVPETIIRFFSYFTIQTNILVAICFTAACGKEFVKSGGLSLRASKLTAAAAYITLTGIVYNVILRFLWQPKGLQLIVDEALHTFQPFLFVLFWLLFVPKGELNWKNCFLWLIYPLIYIIYLIALGELTGFYPYPFANVDELGYGRALLNGIGILVAVLLISFLFVAIAKAVTRRMHRPKTIV